MDYLIGLDLGTTATKAVMFSKSGEIIASSQKAYELKRDAAGMAEESLFDIFEAVLLSVKDLSACLKSDDRLLALSFSSQMHSLIALDENWKPLTQVITWADTRAVRYAEELKETEQGLQLYRKTGTPIHPMAPLSKFLWLKNEKPEIYQQAAHYLDIKGYIFQQLFGTNKMDLSIATGTGIFNIFELDWDREALELTGLQPEQLPEVVDIYEIEAGLSVEFAEKMGISRQTKFVWGAGDGPLSNLGVNAIQPGVVALTIGTSGAIRLVTDKPVTDEKARTFTYALDKEHWVVGGPVNSGGDVLRWLRDSVFEGQLSFEEITDLAAQVAPGAEGLIFHPYLGGERAPLWDANARASFFGLNYSHKRAHMARALLEGIIFNLYTVALSLVEVAGELKEIQATGGFTSSELWTQILADIFEKKINVQETREAGCLAAMVVAQKALGEINRLEEVESLLKTAKTYEANPENFEAYQEMSKIFRDLTQSLKKHYSRIAKYQRKKQDVSRARPEA